MGSLEKFVRVAAGAGVGLGSEHVLASCIVQSIVELSHRGGCIAERRMDCNILDLLAINIDLSPIPKRFQELSTVERALLAFDKGFRGLRHRALHYSYFQVLVRALPAHVKPVRKQK